MRYHHLIVQGKNNCSTGEEYELPSLKREPNLLFPKNKCPSRPASWHSMFWFPSYSTSDPAAKCSERWSKCLIPYTHVGNLDEAPGCILTILTIWGVNQWAEDGSTPLLSKNFVFLNGKVSINMKLIRMEKQNTDMGYLFQANNFVYLISRQKWN